MRYFLGGLVAATPSVLMASQIVLQDDFNDLSHWQDLSTAVTWSGSAGGSVFQSVAGVASLKSSGGDVSGYTTAASLKTFTCLDHRFAVPINRRFQSVTVEARLKWQAAPGDSGEANRFNISFVHDYPTSGLDLTTNARFADFTRAWWARPAYQIRIRGGSTANAKAILQYGGGTDVNGAWEIYNNQWWLPGFNSAPGGGSPGNPAAKGWVFSDTGLASTSWQTFSYTVGPTVQSIAVDGTSHGAQVIGSPDDNPYFNTFDSLEGLRLYWRGASATANVEIDWLTVTVHGVVPNPVASVVEVDGESYLAITYRQPSGGTGAPGIDYKADGFSYTVESNDDLGAVWQSGPSVPGYGQVVPVGDPVGNPDGSQSVTLRLATPVSSSPRQFARLRVTQL